MVRFACAAAAAFFLMLQPAHAARPAAWLACDNDGRCVQQATAGRQKMTARRTYRQNRVTYRAPAPQKAQPGILTTLQRAGAGVVSRACALPGYLADGSRSVLRAFHDRLASVLDVVRPGFVAIGTASGQHAVVAAAAAPRFVAFLRDLEATGYRVAEIGGYARRRIDPRYTRGRSIWSKHASGNAIDINQERRNVVTVPMDRRLVSRLAAQHGLCSGGDWRSPDLGHFEICGGRTRMARARPARVRYALAGRR